MAHDVFISYASGDKAVADAVCATLESHDIRCWIAPRDVLPGLHYGEAIIDAIHECRIMVLVFSSKANLSGHIPKEIERAVSQGSTIMPLRIEDVLPAKSLDYFIGGVHWLDALTPPLEAHLKRLAANVQTLLARNAPPGDSHSLPVAPAPPPATQHAAPPAARPTWTYAVIGALAVIIFVLGFSILRPRFAPQSHSAPPQTSVLPEAQTKIPPAPSAPAPSVAVPVAAKKASAPPDQPVRTAQPIQPSQPNLPKTTAVTSHSGSVVLHQMAGSTMRIEQLIGDEDRQSHQPTRDQTAFRYGIEGAELGYSFEHEGHSYFLFADVVSHAGRGLDAIATTDVTNPEAGAGLDFLTSGQGKFTAIQPTGINMGFNSVPVAGISLGGQMYVVVRANDPKDRADEHSVLTKFTRPSTFQPLRTISKLPSGRFLKMSLHDQPGPIAGLPPGGPFVIMWGTGKYRESDAYLAIVPAAQFESGAGTRYFTGLGESGAPQWSESEADAKPVVKDGTLGDLSVTWCKDLGLWLMTYDRRTLPNGIVLSYSRTPWGPWSEPQLLFNILLDGALGKYIHNPRAQPKDGLAGPVMLPRPRKGDDPDSIRGAAYAPYVVERWTKVRGSELDLYYVMSTLNPYLVVLMKSRLQVE